MEQSEILTFLIYDWFHRCRSIESPARISAVCVINCLRVVLFVLTLHYFSSYYYHTIECKNVSIIRLAIIFRYRKYTQI